MELYLLVYFGIYNIVLHFEHLFNHKTPITPQLVRKRRIMRILLFLAMG